MSTTKTRQTIKIRHINTLPVSEQSTTTLLDRHNSLRTAIIKQFEPTTALRFSNMLYNLLEVERELTLREGQ